MQLEILYRLPRNELLKPIVGNLVKLVMYLLDSENEENAIICLKIIIELHKSFRTSLEGEVQGFIDFVQKIYSELPSTIGYIFSSGPGEQQQQAQQSQKEGDTGAPVKTFLRSVQSCKVLTECPILVVLLFQLYPKFQMANVPSFMPLIVRTLGLQTPENAAKQYPSQYVDFIAAQVKTLSFLAYLLRSVGDHLRPYKEKIPECVIKLLTNTPPQAAAIRKELLIATRHVLSSEFRNGFAVHITTLLDENVMVGTGKTCRKTLRPLAYSTLADLVHHVRNSLPLQHLCKVVHVFSQNVLDPTLTPNVQTMSAKLLLAVVTPLAQKGLDRMGAGGNPALPSTTIPMSAPSADQNYPTARRSVVYILETFVNKFGALKREITRLRELETSLASLSAGEKKTKETTKVNDGFQESRNMLKALVMSLKPVVWNYVSLSQMFYPVEERLSFCRLLRNGLRCCSILTSYPEEKEILDQFAAIFAMLENNLFRDVIRSNIDFIFDKIVQTPATIALAQQFLSRTPVVARCFGEILLEFLLPRISTLGNGDKTSAELIVKLFKHTFQSVTHLEDNESLLVPYLGKIVQSCLSQAESAADPTLFLTLLKGLFRSFSGGKFELIYSEFLPLLSTLLKNLSKQMLSVPNPKLRLIFAELCLTVPVRLSALLPYLRLLTGSIIVALESGTDLIHSGIKMLDMFLDNLSPSLLCPILTDVREELLGAIMMNLSCSGEPHMSKSSENALALILGKLRAFDGFFDAWRDNEEQQHILPLQHQHLKAILTCKPDGTRYPLPLDGLVLTLYKTLCMPRNLSESAARECFNGAKAILCSLLSTNVNLSEFSVSGKDEASNLEESIAEYFSDPNKGVLKTLSDVENESKLVMTLIKCVFKAALIPSTAEDAKDLIKHLCSHFVLMYAGPSESSLTQAEKFISVRQSVFLDAFSACYGASLNRVSASRASKVKQEIKEDPQQQEQSQAEPKHVEALDLSDYVIGQLVHFSENVYGGDASQSPIFEDLAGRGAHLCYSTKWYEKMAGCKVFSNLTQLMPGSWLSKYEFAMVRALLSIVKMVLEVQAVLANQAKDVLTTLCLKCAGPLDNALELLSQHLSHPSDRVREACAQVLIALLKERKDVKLRLEWIVEGKLSAGTQKKAAQLAGTLYAFTFCLNHVPSIKSKDAEELVKVADQVVLLLDSKDDPYSMSLRVLCVKFLAALLASGDQKFNGYRGKALNAFVNGIYHKAEALSEACVAGFEPFLSLPAGELSKAFAQVMELKDRPSPSRLEGIMRLMKVSPKSVPDKYANDLLSQLKSWVDPASVPNTSETVRVSVCSSIIMALALCPNASPLLPDVMKCVFPLETALARCIDTPYRQPLVKFLNIDPAASVTFFFERLATDEAAQLWQFLFAHPAATPLREYLRDHPEMLMKYGFQQPKVPPEKEMNLKYNVVRMVHVLTKHYPEWFAKQVNLLHRFVEIWKSDNIKGAIMASEMLQVTKAHFIKFLLRCFVNYLEHNEDEVDLMFDIMYLFTVRFGDDVQWLQRFFQNLAEKSSLERKKKIITRFLIFYGAALQPEEQKEVVVTLELLVIPTLTSAIGSGDEEDEGNSNAGALVKVEGEQKEELSVDFLKQLLQNVQKHFDLEANKAEGRQENDDLAIELLRLIAVICKYKPEAAVDYRKQLLAYGWKYLKNSDSYTRQSAYIVVAQFLQRSESYQTPEKVFFQVWVALLKAHFPETRKLVRQAIDILLNAIKVQQPIITEEGHVTNWAKYILRMMRDEAHHVNIITHLLALIVRHESVFYDARHSFVSIMVQNMHRIQPSVTENRVLAMRVVKTILDWQKRWVQSEEGKQQEEAASQQQGPNDQAIVKTEGDNAASGTQPQQLQQPQPSKLDRNQPFVTRVIQEQIYNFLVRMASAPNDPSPKGSRPVDIGMWAIELLETCLLLWPDLPMKVSYFERLIEGAKDTAHYGVVALRLLEIICTRQKDFVKKHLRELQTIIIQTFQLNNNLMLGHMVVLLMHIAEVIQAASSEEARAFWEEIAQSLVNVWKVSGQSIVGKAWAPILDTIAIAHPSFLTTEAGISLAFTFTVQLAHKHLSTPQHHQQSHSYQQQQLEDLRSSMRASQMREGAVVAESATLGLENTMNGGSQDSSSQSSPSSALLVPEMPLQNVLLSMVKLVYNAGAHLSTKLKADFVAIITDLFKGSSDVLVLSSILNLVAEWFSASPKFALEKDDLFKLVNCVTLRLKVLDEPHLSSLFLNTIYSALKESSLTDAEKEELQPAFLMGLNTKDTELRGKLFSLWTQAIDTEDVTARLMYTLGKQNWMPVAESLWYRQALYLFLDSVSNGLDVIELDTLTSKVTIHSGKSSKANPSSSKKAKMQTELVDVLNAHGQFLEEAGKTKLEDLLKPLTFLLGEDALLSRSIYVWLFGCIWRNANDGTRLSITLQVNQLLEAPYHSQQPAFCNVVETLLTSLSLCEPTPAVATKLLVSLPRQHGAWLACFSLLEKMLKSNRNVQEEVLLRLSELYRTMGYNQAEIGIWRMMPGISNDSRKAVGYIQHDLLQEAQDILFQAMDKDAEEQQASSSAESNMWEEQWLACAKRLGQWGLLMDFGRNKFDVNLLLHCAWKTEDWLTMQEALKASASSPEIASSPFAGLYGAMGLIINDGGNKQESVKKMINEAIQSGVKEWKGLPSSNQMTEGHKSLVRVFHRIVEVQESLGLVRELTSAKRRVSFLSDIRNKLSGWRDRVPGIHEDLLDWSDVLLWRHHIYGILNRYLHTSVDVDPAVNYIGYQELAWSLCTYARASRKQSFVRSSVDTLGRVYNLPNLLLDDAFLKLKEQVKCYYQLPALFNEGLGILSSTNTEFFSTSQQAEWSVLRGNLLQNQAHQPNVSAESKTHLEEQANTAYSNATQQQKDYAKAWTNWGLFCEKRLEEVTAKEEIKSWSQYLFSCFIQAVIHDPVKGKKHLSRLLMLLTYESSDSDHQTNWMKYHKDLPQWVFLDQIPQIIMSLLMKPENPVFEQTLTQVSLVHPQAVYNWLRTYSGVFLECQKSNSLSKSMNTRLDKVIAILDRCRNHLKEVRPDMVALEEVSTALEEGFASSTPEELCVVEFHDVMKDLELEQLTNRSGANCSIPAPVKSRLTDLAQTDDFAADVAKFASLKSSKSGALHAKLSHLLPMARQRLKMKLEKMMGELSNRLMNSNDQAIEIPGCNIQGKHVADIWNHPSRLRFLSKVDLVPRNQGVQLDCYVYVCAPTGAIHQFLLKRFDHFVDTVREDRLNLLKKFLNEVFQSNMSAMKQGLKFVTPFSAVIGPRLMLCGMPEKMTTLLDVLHQHWNRQGVSGDGLFPAIMKGDSFASIQSSLIPENAFQEVVARTMDNPAALFTFKESFSKQMTLHNALCWMLQMPDKNLGPENVSVSLPSANVALDNMMNTYTLSGNSLALEKEEEKQLHMRMTPNIACMMGRAWTNGVVYPSFFAFLKTFVEKRDRMRSALELFIRDDVFLWMLEENNFDAGSEAVKQFMGRFREEMVSRASAIVTPEKDKAVDANVIDLLNASSSVDTLSSRSKVSQLLYVPFF